MNDVSLHSYIILTCNLPFGTSEQIWIQWRDSAQSTCCKILYDGLMLCKMYLFFTPNTVYLSSKKKKLLILHSPSHFLFLSMSLKHTPAICGVTKGFEHKAKYAFLYVSCISEYTRTLFFFWIMTVNDVRHASVIMPDPPSTLVASTWWTCPLFQAIAQCQRLVRSRCVTQKQMSSFPTNCEWRSNWFTGNICFCFFCLIIFAPNSLL